MQFIKGKWKTGEAEFFAKFPDLCQMHAIGDGFTWNTKDLRWYPDNVVVLRQMEYNNWDKTIDKLYEVMENWEW